MVALWENVARDGVYGSTCQTIISYLLSRGRGKSSSIDYAATAAVRFVGTWKIACKPCWESRDCYSRTIQYVQRVCRVRSGVTLTSSLADSRSPPPTGIVHPQARPSHTTHKVMLSRHPLAGRGIWSDVDSSEYVYNDRFSYCRHALASPLQQTPSITTHIDDTRSTTTIRTRLSSHRHNPSLLTTSSSPRPLHSTHLSV